MGLVGSLKQQIYYCVIAIIGFSAVALMSNSVEAAGGSWGSRLGGFGSGGGLSGGMGSGGGLLGGRAPVRNLLGRLNSRAGNLASRVGSGIGNSVGVGNMFGGSRGGLLSSGSAGSNGGLLGGGRILGGSRGGLLGNGPGIFGGPGLGLGSRGGLLGIRGGGSHYSYGSVGSLAAPTYAPAIAAPIHAPVYAPTIEPTYLAVVPGATSYAVPSYDIPSYDYSSFSVSSPVNSYVMEQSYPVGDYGFEPGYPVQEYSTPMNFGMPMDSGFPLNSGFPVEGSIVGGGVVGDSVIGGDPSNGSIILDGGPIDSMLDTSGMPLDNGLQLDVPTPAPGGQEYYDGLGPGDGSPPPTSDPGLPGPAGDDGTFNFQRSNDTKAVLNLILPKDAKVLINGKSTTTRGRRRSYVSRRLTENRDYKYQVKAIVTRNGKETERTKIVTMRPGVDQTVTLDFEDTVTTLALNVPADAKVKLCGKPTEQTGTFRSYTTSNLSVGKTWKSYKVSVEYVVDGKRRVEERTLDLKAGQQHELAIGVNTAGSQIAAR